MFFVEKRIDHIALIIVLVWFCDFPCTPCTSSAPINLRWICLSSAWVHECTMHYHQQRPPSLIVGSITIDVLWLNTEGAKDLLFLRCATCIGSQQSAAGIWEWMPFFALSWCGYRIPKIIGKGANRRCCCCCRMPSAVVVSSLGFTNKLKAMDSQSPMRINGNCMSTIIISKIVM